MKMRVNLLIARKRTGLISHENRRLHVLAGTMSVIQKRATEKQRDLANVAMEMDTNPRHDGLPDKILKLVE
ncbi:MAG: hypothetical protein K2P80_01890 [Beijerinckiaceae bacterium]|nr:hypothetical protein [Beijerinckiaceae bacterium]